MSEMLSKLKVNITNLHNLSVFAKILAPCILPNLVIALDGNLGAGKTTLVRFILQELGVKGRVKSPTFTYVEPYQVGFLEIYHFDLYRFLSGWQWFDLGFDEYIKANSICFIEWADHAIKAIEKIDLRIQLDICGGDARIVEVVAITEEGEECLNKLIRLVDGLFS